MARGPHGRRDRVAHGRKQPRRGRPSWEGRGEGVDGRRHFTRRNEGETHDVVANDDHTVVLGTAVVTAPSGKSVEYNFVNIFHISDGKITEAWGMAENDAETDPIWDEFASSSSS